MHPTDRHRMTAPDRAGAIAGLPCVTGARDLDSCRGHTRVAARGYDLAPWSERHARFCTGEARDADAA